MLIASDLDRVEMSREEILEVPVSRFSLRQVFPSNCHSLQETVAHYLVSKETKG